METAPRHAVPVFPLPNAVLFPRARLPLHIFELRYRTMVRDALSSGRLIALAMLEPGWEREYHGSPPFHPLGCLGRIDRVEWLPNDCYDLVLAGLARVRFGRVEREFPYRTARVELLEQHPYTHDDPLVKVEQQALGEAFRRLCAARDVTLAPARMPPADADLETQVNVIATMLEMDAREKLALLALDSVIERAHRVREWIERAIRETPRGPEASGGELN